ncbi:helix-turn-helix transcriptional regulator [Microbacteriaceae bacterium VKM Ac-2855]|nr:helix-turn-helix transcriptional regulator [Microbacteriaceae bacterium VKM Ac-2855]
MSPVFGHGRLRLYLLSLLEESPKHGYELIQALSERFGGTYSPSAGTVYPRLAKLEEEGLVTKSVDGRKTVYSITDAGRAELASRASELGDIEDDLTDSVRRLADEVRAGVSEAMRSLRADLANAASEAKARTEESPVSDDARSRSRVALRDAEVALTEFRAEVRAELRTAAARGELPASVVPALRESLAEAREQLRAALR